MRLCFPNSCTSFVEAQKESMALMYTFREEQGRLKSKVNLDASGQSTINSSDLQVLDFAFQDFDSPQPSFCMEDSDLNDLGVMPLSKDTNTTAITDVLSAIIKFLTALLSQTILKQNTRERFVMTVSRGVDWIDVQRRALMEASVQQREMLSQRKVALYVGLQDDSHQLTRYYPDHPCHSYCLDHPRHPHSLDHPRRRRLIPLQQAMPPARIDDEELVDDPRDSLASDVIDSLTPTLTLANCPSDPKTGPLPGLVDHSFPHIMSVRFQLMQQLMGDEELVQRVPTHPFCEVKAITFTINSVQVGIAERTTTFTYTCDTVFDGNWQVSIHKTSGTDG
ncbi:Hypp9360 [Branchiostoma lanceolatum]|uniref:Hypp9360 protein n=1 Tax=Branchiostoma lanceolatum TaxID=7740 RepID=A0A8S4MLD7_BRALA|nr:Hypp9360 [Branchiostoma lanceolatum]